MEPGVGYSQNDLKHMGQVRLLPDSYFYKSVRCTEIMVIKNGHLVKIIDITTDSLKTSSLK